MIMARFCFNNQRKTMAVRVALDFSCILAVAIGYFAVHEGAEPYHRGFFCDDESIKHPVHSDTISVPVMCLVAIPLPALMIIFIEVLLRRGNEKLCMKSRKSIFNPRQSWMVASYTYIKVFVFGLGVTMFLTEVGKVSIGRLRPHFLTLCAPDWSKVNCSQGYITADVCTSTDTAKLKEARLSFPSGHSSFSMYCMLYSMLYLQARISCKSVTLLKPLFLLAFFAMGFYTCLSRVSDYMHHWSDVLAGAILGMVVATCVVKGLTDLGPNLCGVKLRDISRLTASVSGSNKPEKTTTYGSRLSNNSVDDTQDNSRVINIDE